MDFYAAASVMIAVWQTKKTKWAHIIYIIMQVTRNSDSEVYICWFTDFFLCNIGNWRHQSLLVDEFLFFFYYCDLHTHRLVFVCVPYAFVTYQWWFCWKWHALAYDLPVKKNKKKWRQKWLSIVTKGTRLFGVTWGHKITLLLVTHSQHFSSAHGFRHSALATESFSLLLKS